MSEKTQEKAHDKKSSSSSYLGQYLSKKSPNVCLETQHGYKENQASPMSSAEVSSVIGEHAAQKPAEFFDTGNSNLSNSNKTVMKGYSSCYHKNATNKKRPSNSAAVSESNSGLSAVKSSLTSGKPLKTDPRPPQTELNEDQRGSYYRKYRKKVLLSKNESLCDPNHHQPVHDLGGPIYMELIWSLICIS